MAQVVALDPLSDESGAPRRLRFLSRALVLLFSVLLGLAILLLLATAVFSLFLSSHVLMNSTSAGVWFGPHGAPPALRPGMVRLSDMPFITHLGTIVSMGLGLTPVLAVFLHLRGLFGLYAAGTVFARENARHLNRIGLWLIAYPACNFASNMLFRAAGGTDHRWLGPASVQAPILGLIIVAIALVMEFGRQIEQEKDEFI